MPSASAFCRPHHNVSRSLNSNNSNRTVIDAWAKAGKGVMGAKRCERLIERLENLYQSSGGDPKLRPGPKHFGAVIDAYSRADELESTAEHAEKFLDKLEDLFLHSTNRNDTLSNIVYNLGESKPILLFIKFHILKS